jgi:hypothetical protein|tara:strand:- start:1741 stop:2163 length:423 start_codon:yes stop_codon:yes gene_type:complete
MLFLIYLITLFFGLLAFFTDIISIEMFDTIVKFELSEILQVSLFYISMTLSYIILYNVLDEGSASLPMINIIGNAGSTGVERASLEKVMKKELALRFNYLISDKMIYINNSKYRLTKKGLFYIKLILFYSRLLHYNDKYG